jgi:hypothetical protein
MGRISKWIRKVLLRYLREVVSEGVGTMKNILIVLVITLFVTRHWRSVTGER